MKLNAQEVVDKLLKEDKILDLEGRIQFYLGDVSIIVKQKDVVGNIMQEWLQGWLEKNDIDFCLNDNTQMPPDFFLDPTDKTKSLLEVKAFNRNASPGFDIADFRMYAEEIIQKPYMLDVDYLIFGYDMSDDGKVTIKDVWLKKVWQICRRMKNFPINLQVKENVIHKIRPGVWYSTKDVDYPIFRSLEDFISAIEETTFSEPRLRSTIAPTWKSTFQENYKKFNGKELDIPRWNEIKDSYDFKAIKQKEKLEQKIKKIKNDKETKKLKVIELQGLIKKGKQEEKRLETINKYTLNIETLDKKLQELVADLKNNMENFTKNKS